MIGSLISWDTLLAARDLFRQGRNAYNKLTIQSASQSASRAIISPLTIFEEPLAHQEYMLDLMTIINLRDIRDALTHINLQSEVGKLKIADLVEEINPNRTAGFMCLQGVESFSSNNKKNEDDTPTDKKGTAMFKAEEFKSLTEFVPLALGRTVSASVNVDGNEMSFPLTFRQIPMPAASSNIILMFQAVKGGDGWSARIDEYKSGGITLPDLLTGTDEIRNEFKIRTQDLSGYYSETLNRVKKNKLMTLGTGIFSMNNLANTIIISKETANAIELEIGIRFGSSKINQIRKYVRANTIVIVNDARGIFEFHTCSSNLVVKYTRDQIRTKAKKENAGSLESLVTLLDGR